MHHKERFMHVPFLILSLQVSHISNSKNWQKSLAIINMLSKTAQVFKRDKTKFQPIS